MDAFALFQATRGFKSKPFFTAKPFGSFFTLAGGLPTSIYPGQSLLVSNRYHLRGAHHTRPPGQIPPKLPGVRVTIARLESGSLLAGSIFTLTPRSWLPRQHPRFGHPRELQSADLLPSLSVQSIQPSSGHCLQASPFLFLPVTPHFP